LDIRKIRYIFVSTKGNKNMETYIRFTENFGSEGNSYFKTPSMKSAVRLNGVCAFPFDIFDLAEDEIRNKARQYHKNFGYYGSKAVIFEGTYIENNKNGEGVIVEKGSKLYEFNF